ncbi:MULTISPECIES: DUF885 family protein [unclassified Duganella]|uniref:DUF885 domain-containing protein n=1 Tax=unclassified Duganella TaxID=2636909 RepID=UPI0006FBFFC2|nr:MULTISPECIES: DUF885 family protein [unclassified Duganella]KQV59856.1 hypothetical protein ASD07_23910 [Duganella sp. Root336D2]KRB87334.1 hypothetical protein ASE26_08115 [Duganella sp. Root198D2]
MKQIVAALAIAAAFSSPSFAAAKPGSADARFTAIHKAEWKWRLQQRLEDDEDDVRGVESRLPNVSLAVQMERQKKWEETLRQLESIKPEQLSNRERINYQVYRAQVAALLDNQRFREYEKPLNADSSFWGNLAGEARKSFRTAEDYRNYVAQLNDVPRYFGEEITNMRAGLARGFTPPKITLEGRDKSITSVTEARPEDVVFFKPFKDMPNVIPAAEQEALKAEGLKAIREKVIPAHAVLLKFMREEYVPKAKEALDAESYPDGKAYYQSKIVEFTTTNLSAEQIHQIGLDEMAKIRAEMQEVMKQVGFKGDLPAFLQFLRTDPRFYAKTPEELLMRAAWVAKKFDGKVADYFGRLPRSRFAIIPVAPEVAPFYTSGRGGPGGYWVNTYNLPARPLYSLPALTLHESAPGHAFQMPIALEQKGRPPFRNAYISAYGEGWALYSERLGTEMGIYETPYEVFGMLSYQAWRASRLVVDTGVHAKGWTREQAQKYLMENTALSSHEVMTEVDRYISWPGQALSYYLGEMAIFEARKKAEQALGARFDIRAFHDTILELGSVPLPVLQARIDDFIAGGGKSPYPKE